ncbi:MAG: dCTP deaminase [Chloroflexales bacterium]
MLKNDRWIKVMADRGMITPHAPTKVRAGSDGRSILSYGVESYGYTLQVADEWMIVNPALSAAQLEQMPVDPKDPATLAAVLVPVTAPHITVPPHSFVLARSAERWNIPRTVLCVVLGKSSLARCGLILNVTPLEPTWGSENAAGGDFITLEISNTAPFPVVVYANEGIGQVIFLEGDEPPQRDYRAGGGRYQGQDGITLPR